GQYPVAVYLGPYLPDVTGSIVCFIGLLALLRVWQPKQTLAYGGVPLDAASAARNRGHGLKGGDVLLAWMPFVVLLVVVAAWTGPWSPLPKVSWFLTKVVASAPALGADAKITAQFNFAPWIGGSAILASWIIVAVLLITMGKLKASQ